MKVMARCGRCKRIVRASIVAVPTERDTTVSAQSPQPVHYDGGENAV